MITPYKGFQYYFEFTCLRCPETLSDKPTNASQRVAICERANKLGVGRPRVASSESITL